MHERSNSSHVCVFVAMFFFGWCSTCLAMRPSHLRLVLMHASGSSHDKPAR